VLAEDDDGDVGDDADDDDDDDGREDGSGDKNAADGTTFFNLGDGAGVIIFPTAARLTQLLSSFFFQSALFLLLLSLLVGLLLVLLLFLLLLSPLSLTFLLSRPLLPKANFLLLPYKTVDVVAVVAVVKGTCRRCGC
jgi:hypothetical protein